MSILEGMLPVNISLKFSSNIDSLFTRLRIYNICWQEVSPTSLSIILGLVILHFLSTSCVGLQTLSLGDHFARWWSLLIIGLLIILAQKFCVFFMMQRNSKVSNFRLLGFQTRFNQWMVENDRFFCLWQQKYGGLVAKMVESLSFGNTTRVIFKPHTCCESCHLILGSIWIIWTLQNQSHIWKIQSQWW